MHCIVQQWWLFLLSIDSLWQLLWPQAFFWDFYDFCVNKPQLKCWNIQMRGFQNNKNNGAKPHSNQILSRLKERKGKNLKKVWNSNIQREIHCISRTLHEKTMTLVRFFVCVEFGNWLKWLSYHESACVISCILYIHSIHRNFQQVRIERAFSTRHNKA